MERVLEFSTSGYLGLLSDEVLLLILENLPTPSLYNVMWTCKRLNVLCQESKLWTEIDDPPDTEESLRYAITNLLNKGTTRVKLTSSAHPTNRGYRSSLCPSVFNLLTVNGQNLSQLHLIRQRLDGKTFRLLDLPGSLKLLDMTGCIVINVSEQTYYFKDINLHFIHLEDLDLSYCNWVSAHSLMSISKLPQLTRLSLKGCRAIGECLAYVALSSRFGFQKLKMLDVTDTLVGSSEFTAFGGISTLQEFYFGQYDHFIDLQYNTITDLCLSRVRNSKSLKILDMSGSLVTDVTLEILQTMPNLERIDAHFTRFTDVGISTFRQRKPNCIINKAETVIIPPLSLENQNLASRFSQGEDNIFEIFVDLHHPNHNHHHL